jgi:hypothetical protein
VNLLKSKLRRTTTVIGGSFLGLAGVVVMAVPALACHANITPESSCVNTDGSWVVKWQVANSEPDLVGSIKKITLTPSDSSLTGIKEGDELPKSSQGSLTATQTLSASASSAGLEITGHWANRGNPIESTRSASTGKPTQLCEGQTPPTTPPTTPATTEPTTPATTAPTTPATTAPTTAPTTTAPTTAPTTTAPATTEPTSTAPTTAPTPTPTVSVPVPSDTPPDTVLPTPIVDIDCSTMTFGLDNTKGTIEYKMHFKTSKGEVRDLDIKPGEKKSEKFSATTGFKLTITFSAIVDGNSYPDTETFTYVKPDDCDDNGSGGGLALTGANAGGIAGGAALLLAIGGGLFFLARRRKVNFTA